MAVRPILLCGNPVLRRKAEKVSKISKSIIQLVDDMFETLEESKGIGLAAPQIGISKSVVIVDLHLKKENFRIAMVNPVITKKYGEPDFYPEGCLSVPEVWADVKRPSVIDVTFMSLEGKTEKIIGADKMFARVIQHEVDHLNGILFIDKIDKIERDKIAGDIERIKMNSKTGGKDSEYIVRGKF